MARAGLLCMAAVGLAALSAAAWAQEAVRTIYPGETLRGALSENDTSAGDATVYDRYRFEAKAGETYAVLLESDEFDAFLIVRGPGYDESDDDGGDGTNSRLQFTPARSGTYEIRANSLERATGAYALSLTEVARASEVRPIAQGQTVRGLLTSGSPRYGKGTPYQAYVFDGAGGTRVTIDMTSERFDTYLVLRREGEAEELAADDDGGGQLNSRITFTLPSSGRYEIVATSVSNGDAGPYVLSLGDGPKRSAPAAQKIVYGEVRRGALEDGDGLDEKDSLYDLYEFTGRRGDRVVIRLISDHFDPMLYLRGGNGEILAEDDDGGEDALDARIEFTLPESGDYRISASAFEQGQGGAYILGLGSAP